MDMQKHRRSSAALCPMPLGPHHRTAAPPPHQRFLPGRRAAAPPHRRTAAAPPHRRTAAAPPHLVRTSAPPAPPAPPHLRTSRTSAPPHLRISCLCSDEEELEELLLKRTGIPSCVGCWLCWIPVRKAQCTLRTRLRSSLF